MRIESLEPKVEPKMGMWLFIGTELLLFGGLFLLYSIYRMEHQSDFAHASLGHSRVVGAINTIILITSSFSIALAIHFQKEKRATPAKLSLGLTILLGTMFLVIKAFEWAELFSRGIFPGKPELLALPAGEILDNGLYYLMTGLHALHMVIGIGILVGIYIMLLRRFDSAKTTAFFEGTGLYWHMVDIIWIFLFPFFYLIT